MENEVEMRETVEEGVLLAQAVLNPVRQDARVAERHELATALIASAVSGKRRILSASEAHGMNDDAERGALALLVINTSFAALSTRPVRVQRAMDRWEQLDQGH